MTRLLSSDHISCSECEYFKWCSSFPHLGVCENMDSEHYGHSLAKFHQICGGFFQKVKKDPMVPICKEKDGL